MLLISRQMAAQLEDDTGNALLEALAPVGHQSLPLAAVALQLGLHVVQVNRRRLGWAMHTVMEYGPTLMARCAWWRDKVSWARDQLDSAGALLERW